MKKSINKLSDSYMSIKEVFPKEEKDFSPWIVENIQDISEIIGYQLTNCITEKNVGRYECDIVCNDAYDEDVKVIIENKLGTIDHDHIGKALTYMGYERAKCIVWICDNYYDEHIKAINYLNEITSSEFNFYAIKVDFYKFDNDIKYNFTAIAKPDETSKRLYSVSSNDMTENNKLNLSYFNKLRELINDDEINNNIWVEQRGKGYAATTRAYNKNFSILITLSLRSHKTLIRIETMNKGRDYINNIYDYVVKEFPDVDFEITEGKKNKSIIRISGLESAEYKDNIFDTINWTKDTFVNMYHKLKNFDNKI